MRLSRSPSARAFAALLALGLAVAAASRAEAAPLRRVSVQMDLHGVGAIASHIRRSLPQALARELAQNPVEGYPPGARLVVRVTEIFLANDPGMRGGRFGGGMAMPDALEGEAVILDARGGIIAQKRVSGRSAPSSGGLGISPYNEPRRVEALVENFAYWIVRNLN